MKKEGKQLPGAAKRPAGSTEDLRQELVAHFHHLREPLRKQWVELMTAEGLLGGLSPVDLENESATFHDACLNCMEAGKSESARDLAVTIVGNAPRRGRTFQQIIDGKLIMHRLHNRSLFERYAGDGEKLFAALTMHDSVSSSVFSFLAAAYIGEQEKIVRQQQEALRELSTPVLQVREGLLTLPIIGLIDTERARRLTEQLLRQIRANRAKVVVLDITGVAAIDSKVANHLVQTVEAARLLGAQVIVTGISPEIAQTLVAIGVDLSKIDTVCDLQGGIDKADRMIGYRVVKAEETSDSVSQG